jgi:phage virion morphogenesis protein
VSGVALHYDLATANERLLAHIDRIAGLDRRRLLDTIGVEVESQVRARIEQEKAGPDGTPWPKWSARYAKTRHGGHSLLEGEGDLLGSINAYIYLDGSAVEIGSNLIYAATHQYGDAERNIDPRPYLGLSADNEAELQSVVETFLAGVLQ